ncbi:TolC family protein [Vogesella oryzae]|uniref:TolC family protein n=1 Tax=Vogesella oryzae TaxID=1735285 RepID=UPI001583AE97|nr:TolC family protein [Vogesella oryzae]
MTRLLLPALIALALMPAAQALDLQQAWQAARGHDPQLAASEANGRADATLPAQGRAMLRPKLGLVAGGGWGSMDQLTRGARFVTPGMSSDQVEFESKVSGGTRQWWGLEARQMLYDASASATAGQLAAQGQAGAANLVAARQQAMLQLAARYFDVLAADAQLAALAQQQRATREALDATQARYQAGDAPITDLEEARARLALLDADTLALQQQHQLAVQRLSDLTGLPPATLQDLPAGGTLPLPALAPLTDWQQQARQRNPQLQASQAGRDAARLEAGKHSAGGSPKLELVARAGDERWRDSDASQRSRQQFVGVELTIPLYTGGYRDAKYSEALARQDAAEAGVNAAALAVNDAVHNAWLGVSQGQSRLAALQLAEQAARRQLDATRMGREEGARTTLDLLNAEQGVAEVVKQRALLRYQTLYQWLALHAAAGTLDDSVIANLKPLFATSGKQP